MSAARLEARLAALLSAPGLDVGTGVAVAGGAATAAAVAVAAISPRPALSARRPAELVRHTPLRLSSVTVRAVVTVAAAAGAAGRAAALDAATDLWWRCEDDPVATGSGFPAGDLTEGYAVLEVRPVGWTTPNAAAATHAAVEPQPVHRIELDVDALVWPRDVTPPAGGQIGPVLLRLGAAPAVSVPVRVAAGQRMTVGVELDLRSAVVRPGLGDTTAAAPRRIGVTVEPRGDAPAGSVDAPAVDLDGYRATIAYTAGGTPGRDDLRLVLLPDGGPPVPLGTVPVEVVAR